METQYFDSLTSKINSANSCASLSTIQVDVTSELNKQLAAAQATVNRLAPVITPPTTPTEVITWINNYISLITAPYNEATSMLTTIPIQAAAFAAAIAAKQSELGC